MVNKGQYWYGLSRTFQQGYATIAAGSTGKLSHFVAPWACKIVKCSISVDSAITGAATNNQILRFGNAGPSGSGTSIIATKTFGSGTDATAFDENDLGAVSNNLLNEGDVVYFEKAENGSGAIMPALLAKIDIVRVA